MLNSIRLKFNLGRLRYDIEIRNKYTFVRGDSGTGKSTLIEALQNPQTRFDIKEASIIELPELPPYPRDRVIGGLPGSSEVINSDYRKIEDLNPKELKILRKAQIRSALQTLLDSQSPKIVVFYADEDLSYIYTTEFCSVIKELDAILLISYRSRIPSVSCGIDSFYKLMLDGDYKLVPIFTYETFNKGYGRLDSASTEDSVSGNKYLQQLFPFVDSMPSGRSYLEHIILDKYMLFILDGVGLSNQTINLNDYRKGLCDVYLIPSFEKMILDMMFKDSVQPNILCSNHEKFYENRLSTLLYSLSGAKYTKSKIHQCLKNNCSECTKAGSCLSKGDNRYHIYPDLYSLLCGIYTSEQGYEKTNLF